MISRRTIIRGVPLCCWPGELLDLVKGVLWGWVRVRFIAYPGSRWLTWKAWYTPGFLHLHGRGMACRHGTPPPCPHCRRPLDATACNEHHAALHFEEEATRSEAA